MFRIALGGFLVMALMVACAPNKDKKRSIRPVSPKLGKIKSGDDINKIKNDRGDQQDSLGKIPGADSNPKLGNNVPTDTGEKLGSQINIEEVIKEYNETNQQITELYGPINVQLGINSISEVAKEDFDKNKIAEEISSESIVLLNNSVNELLQLEKSQLLRLRKIEKSNYYGNHDKKLVLEIISKVNVKIDILEALSLLIKERVKNDPKLTSATESPAG